MRYRNGKAMPSLASYRLPASSSGGDSCSVWACTGDCRRATYLRPGLCAVEHPTTLPAVTAARLPGRRWSAPRPCLPPSPFTRLRVAMLPYTTSYVTMDDPKQAMSLPLDVVQVGARAADRVYG
jgi:hypothetical protein